MIPLIIGIVSGLLTILLIVILRLRDAKLIYGLVLSGIGFLYVGFVWTDGKALVITAVQAIAFVLLAYYGVKRNYHLLAAGYFLHGCWDIVYNFLATPGLVPPHYDWFCSSLDFTIGIYLVFYSRKLQLHSIIA
ncbi:MAG: DUF6010 family protein [Chitinophagaceae bacterium]